MNTHRGRSSVPVKREPPTHIATTRNQVWTWDITWLNAFIKGQYYKLYLIIDMFSRLIVGYEVWEEEKAKAKHPERWSKDIRNWSLPKYVSLNPISEDEAKKFIKEKNN